jgi:hypothetical protein
LIQGGKEMMAERRRGILGRADDGVAPGKGYRDFIGYFSILVSGFPLTYRDEIIDEGSVWEERAKRWLGFTHMSGGDQRPMC